MKEMPVRRDERSKNVNERRRERARGMVCDDRLLVETKETSRKGRRKERKIKGKEDRVLAGRI